MSLLSRLSRYIYGTTRLGDAGIPLADRVRIARAAMDSGVWFHTSRQYNDALETLRAAFDEDRAKVPRLIVKIGNSNLQELRADIAANLHPLGLDGIDVGQLCLGGGYAESARTNGACFDDFRRLRDEGLVKHFVMEVFPWTSETPLAALRKGYLDGIVDAFIFYLNPLQRFADNRLWDAIQQSDFPVIGMRAVCGAPAPVLRDVPGAAWAPYLQTRAVAVAPIFERSGIRSWTEFCVRFSFSFPQVKATVGSTARQAYLDEYSRVCLADTIEPLPSDIVAELSALQRKWSDAVDVRAKPWTM